MGSEIRMTAGRLDVPNDPTIPFVVGDGIGVDITPAMQHVVDRAVAIAYGGVRRIDWHEVLAGEKALAAEGEYLPEATLSAFRRYLVGIKGPLSTPVGGGIRSLNVALRQVLDLYSCIRPVRWYGSASPVVHPEEMDLIIFRENTEDVYAGIEYPESSSQAHRLIALLRELGVGPDKLGDDAAIGIKPISPSRTKRHVRKALRFARDRARSTVTFMHKGNIMKYTEGGFVRWAYEVLEEPEFQGLFEIQQNPGPRRLRAGRIAVNDRIADNLFQQIITRADEYDVIVTTNLNGDYLSDAAAASAGGLGMAPGTNEGETISIFEATHGSAPQYAGLDKVNPSSLILSAAMMLEHIGWGEASQRIQAGITRTLRERKGTYDLVRGWARVSSERAVELSCSAFAEEVARNL